MAACRSMIAPVRGEEGKDMAMRVLVLLMAAVVASTALALTKGEMVTGMRKEVILFSDCAPVDAVLIRGLSDDAKAIGLTEQAIRNVAKSRLRSIGLVNDLQPTYDDIVFREVKHYLVVSVSVVANAFSSYISLERFLPDTGYGMPGFVSVWHRRVTGTHGMNGQNILGRVSDDFDGFVRGHLAVNNEKSCGTPRESP